jgi:hypothetical protein
VKWKEMAKSFFQQIKKALIEALVLVSPDYTKDFIVFPFSSEHTITIVLLQKNQDGFEQPIAFFSRAMRDTELKYNIMEKKAFLWLNV